MNSKSPNLRVLLVCKQEEEDCLKTEQKEQETINPIEKIIEQTQEIMRSNTKSFPLEIGLHLHKAGNGCSAQDEQKMLEEIVKSPENLILMTRAVKLSEPWKSLMKKNVFMLDELSPVHIMIMIKGYLASIRL